MSYKNRTNSNTDRIDSKLKREERMSFKNFVQSVKEERETESGNYYFDENYDAELETVRRKKFFGYDTELNLENYEVLNQGDSVKIGFTDEELGEQFIYFDEGMWFDVHEMHVAESMTTIDRRGREWRVYREEDGTLIFFDDNIDLEATAHISDLAEIFSKVW